MRKFVAFAVFAAALVGLSVSRPVGADDKKEKLKVDVEVPYVPTNTKVVEAMLKLAAVKEGDTVYDLGCGDGRIVITAVGQFKAKRGLGLDFNPARLKDCEESVQKAIKDKKLTAAQAKTLTFKQGDVLKMKPEDFKGVDVVTLYLLPDVNLRLKPVLQKGLKPGARVVSHDFHMGEDWKADKKEEVKYMSEFGERTADIYLWTIKK
jgi:SAM-dependent methyltransferase